MFNSHPRGVHFTAPRSHVGIRGFNVAANKSFCHISRDYCRAYLLRCKLQFYTWPTEQLYVASHHNENLNRSNLFQFVWLRNLYFEYKFGVHNISAMCLWVTMTVITDISKCETALYHKGIYLYYSNKGHVNYRLSPPDANIYVDNMHGIHIVKNQVWWHCQ